MSSGGGGGGGNVPANTTQVQTIREAPEIEARRLGLMDAAKELAQKKLHLLLLESHQCQLQKLKL